MTLLEDRDFKDVPSIPEYYRGKTVFITGGSGFMGKVLVEKLLYSCTDLDRIYLLLRPKRGVKPEDRLAEIFGTRCFDRLREEKPGVFESKVFCIAGDCGEAALGLSEEDRALLVNRTNIVFHVAASIRFDDMLKTAARLNLQGTKEMIELAKDMQNLECFMYVSTSYSNANRDTIEEIMYPPLANWRETLEICENIDNQALNVFTHKFLDKVPNTYVICKQLAEHVVYEQTGKLPVVIIRPSIVMPSAEEPVPGYLENFNGPVGLIVASGKGILRALYAHPHVSGDYMPVDIAIKGFIVASWIRGTKKTTCVTYETLPPVRKAVLLRRAGKKLSSSSFLQKVKRLEPTDVTPIYNCCNGPLGYRITATEIFAVGHKIIAEIPLDNMVWSAGGAITCNKSLYFMKVILLQVLPALFIDSLLWLFGKKTMLLKIQRRIYIANLALAYFLTRKLTFLNKNFISIRSKIKEEDKSHFYYNMENVDFNEYFRKSILGGRRYLLKEKDEDLPKARVHLRRMNILDTSVRSLFYGCIIWMIVKRLIVPYLFE